MHEHSVTKDIFEIILKHAIKNKAKKVISVNLEISVISDFQNEWVQKYFDSLSKDTVVQNAKLVITRVPAEFWCENCKSTYKINKPLTGELSCEKCEAKKVTLISGKDYKIRNMKIE